MESSFIHLSGLGKRTFTASDIPSRAEFRAFIIQQMELMTQIPGRTFETQLRHAIRYMNRRRNEPGWSQKFSAWFCAQGECRDDNPASPAGAARITQKFVDMFPDLFPGRKPSEPARSGSGSSSTSTSSNGQTTTPLAPIQAGFLSGSPWLVAGTVILLGGAGLTFFKTIRKRQ